jgi:multisubunit Na+/H+ antiporter MnhB subunit
MSVGLSAYSVAVYSFQRYRVTANPFQFRDFSQAYWRVTVATICGVWIVAALFAVPSALSKYLCEENLFSKNSFIHTYYMRVVIFEHLVSCVLPLCVVAFSYIMTARLLVESARSISEGTQNPQLETRRKTAKIVVGLAVVFLISYVPYHVFWTYFIYSKIYIPITNFDEDIEQSIIKIQYTYLISNSFFFINSCLNPVAVFCTSSPFRQYLKRYLTWFCKTNSPPTDFELRRRN